MNQWIQQHRYITGRELAQLLQARVHKPISKQVANLYRRRLGYKGKRQRKKPHFVFIPPLSPDLNPIEKVWARLDAVLPKTKITQSVKKIGIPYLIRSFPSCLKFVPK